MSERKIPIKYAGADWMLAHPAIARRDISPSPLGIKVMNILGQMWQGIYHVDDYVLKPAVRWDAKIAIAVTIYGCLSTYDFPLLTMLVLCCQKAEVSVGVYGSFKGYTQLIFCPNPDGVPKLMSPLSINEKSSLEQRLAQCTHIKKKLQDIHRGYIWSTEGLHWHHLLAMVDIAHRTATRFQVEGRSTHTLEVMVTQRDREGGFSQRHPDWETHREKLRPYWDVDYTSLD